MYTPSNQIPKEIRKIYLMAICGTGMGSLAGLLKDKGFEVCGSDNNVYPPMSENLQNQGIKILSPYNAQNIENEKPDLVIIGNAISKNHPEAEYVLNQNIPYISMPQALKHFFLSDKDVIVVSGTHGKTTTTAIMSYLLIELGEKPSFMVGGVTQNLGKNFQIGTGKYFVIEGDEYDTAFFDKGPKFLHYNPKHVIMTSLEFDHADIYNDLDHIKSSFIKLAKIIPNEGSLHYSDNYSALSDVIPHAQCYKTRYGFTNSEWKIDNYKNTGTESSFDLTHNNELIVHIDSPMTGKHNAFNVAACFSVLKTLNLDLKKAAQALKGFKGVKRRQEVLYSDDLLTVIDDFAHHPTAVNLTIDAIKEKFKNHKLIAVFEPRSNTSMRDIFQKDYMKSFLNADEILLAPVFNPKKVASGKILNIDELKNELVKNGKSALNFNSTEEIIEHITKNLNKPTVALIMSNGGFDNIHKKLIEKRKSLS